MTVRILKYLQAGLLCALSLCLPVTAYAMHDGISDPPLRLAQTEPSSPAEPVAKMPLDVKNVFRNICGFCHESYGRRAAKGPQLMNSERSDEFLFNRIKNGMPGRMAAWGSIYNDEQIRQIVKFIRSLKPDEEPQNP